MTAFRRLCPEQLLRPGEDVEIGRVAQRAPRTRRICRSIDAMAPSKRPAGADSSQAEDYSCFVVKDLNGQALAYMSHRVPMLVPSCYYTRRSPPHLPSKRIRFHPCR